MTNESGSARVRASLSPSSVSLAPGRQSQVEVTVFNGSGVVDEFAISLVDNSGLEFTRPPEILSLFPGGQGTVTLHLRVPEDARLGAGRQVVGVRVQSILHPEAVWVEELTLDVVPQTDVSIRLEPQSLKGGSSASATVIATNRGTTDTNLTLTGSDPEGVVRFEFSPAQSEIPHHQDARVGMRVSAPRRLTGQTDHRTLKISAEGAGISVQTDGVFIQRPRIPRFVLRLGALLLTGALAVTALFMAGVLPPGAGAETSLIEYFRPVGEAVGGCVEVEWSATNSEVVRLVTPREGTTTVEPRGSRSVCGDDGDVTTLIATGADENREELEIVISNRLAIGEPQVQLVGRTLIVDLVTNQRASVAFRAGGMEETSSGTTNHHFELEDLPSGDTQWDLTASAPNQLDVTRSGSVSVPFYYGRLTVVDGPRFVSTAPTTAGGFQTVLLGDYYALSTDPVYRLLGSTCSQVEGGVVEELIIPIEFDGSGSASVAVAYCPFIFFQPGGEPPPPTPVEDLAVEDMVCALEEGFDAEVVECPLQFEKEGGFVSLTVRLERVVAEDEPDYS